MNTLTRHDLHWAVHRLPKVLRDHCEKRRNLCVIAGGYLRSIVCNEPVNDIDLFVSGRMEAEDLVRLLRNEKKAHQWLEHSVHESENATTIKGYQFDLQVIHRWTFSEAYLVANSFDFTCCSAALWHDGKVWQSVCDERFYPDVAAKRLVYRAPDRAEDAGGSLLRVLKYYQRGYRIPLDSFAAVIARTLSKIDLQEVDPVMNTEEAIAKYVLGQLRVVDPAVDPNHEAHLPAEKAPKGSSGGGHLA